MHIVFVGPCVCHLFILYFQCGQAGLQLLASLDQLSLHGLLGTQMSHLREKDRRKCLRTSTTEWRRTKASPSPAVIKLISPYAPNICLLRTFFPTRSLYFLPITAGEHLAHCGPPSPWGLNTRQGTRALGKTSCSVHHTHTNIQDPWRKVG